MPGKFEIDLGRKWISGPAGTRRRRFRRGRARLLAGVIGVGLIATACGSTSTSASKSSSPAPTFPTHLVTIVSYSPPGSAVDLLGREVAKLAPQYFKGVHFVVQDVTGGGPSNGLDYLLSKPANGSTWVIDTRSIATELATTLKSEFKLSQFQFQSTIVGDPYDIAVNPASGITTFAQLIAAARKNPNFTFGGFSTGSPQEFLPLLLSQEFHFKFNWVPFSGGAPATTALLGNHIDAGSLNFSYSLQQAEAHQIRMLGMSLTSPSPQLPGVPTFQSLGAQNLIAESVHWMGVFTRSGTPAAVSQKIQTGLAAIVKSPTFLAFEKKFGFVPYLVAGSALQKLVQNTYSAFAKQFG